MIGTIVIWMLFFLWKFWIPWLMENLKGMIDIPIIQPYKTIWMFSKIGEPPVIIQFLMGFSLTKTIQRAWGYSQRAGKPPNITNSGHISWFWCPRHGIRFDIFCGPDVTIEWWELVEPCIKLYRHTPHARKGKPGASNWVSKNHKKFLFHLMIQIVISRKILFHFTDLQSVL